MTIDDAVRGAQSILDSRTDLNEIRVLVDNPNDCSATIKAFRQLGCRVKVQNDGRILVVTRPVTA